MQIGPEPDTKVLAFRQAARETPITFPERVVSNISTPPAHFSADSAAFNNYRRPIKRFDSANNVVSCAVFLAKGFALMGIFATGLSRYLYRRPRLVNGLNVGAGLTFVASGVSIAALSQK